MRFEKSGEINASINKVYGCLTDIGFVKSEISRLKKQERPKLHYDKKNPFGKDNKIILSFDSFQVIFQIDESVEPNRLSMNIFSSKYKQIFGSLFYEANLTKIEDKTLYKFSYMTGKKPNFIIASIMKIYLWLCITGTHKRFNKYVQSSKNV